MPGRVLSFELDRPTPLLNRTLRQHWSGRMRDQRALAWAIRVALQGQQLPAQPFRRARVTIVRRSAGTPDHDGLLGGVKSLVDCLLDPGPVTIRNGKARCLHPTGLGIVQDDSPACMTLVVQAERVPKDRQGTSVTIEELE